MQLELGIEEGQNQKQINMKKKSVKKELSRVELLAGALQMQGIGISQEIAEQMLLTLERVDILKGGFSLMDAVEIRHRIELKYASGKKSEEERIVRNQEKRDDALVEKIVLALKSFGKNV